MLNTMREKEKRSILAPPENKRPWGCGLGHPSLNYDKFRLNWAQCKFKSQFCWTSKQLKIDSTQCRYLNGGLDDLPFFCFVEVNCTPLIPAYILFFSRKTDCRSSSHSKMEISFLKEKGEKRRSKPTVRFVVHRGQMAQISSDAHPGAIGPKFGEAAKRGCVP